MRYIFEFFSISVCLLHICLLQSCSRANLQSQLTISSELIPLPDNSSAGTNPSYAPADFEPLAWESKVKGASTWSKTVYDVILNEEPQMLGQSVADDVELFCPKYRTLADHQRLNFWGQLFAAISKFESSWNPASYFVETTMGLDPITGRQVASEGLLQLSYQDEKSYRLECGFDWATDMNLKNTDARKTIFNPSNNLRCGVKILAKQLSLKRAISTSSNVYWAVLKKNGAYTKVPQIAEITQQLSFCK